jgi:hypothetical protein
VLMVVLANKSKEWEKWIWFCSKISLPAAPGAYFDHFCM